jgi:hypothetical protein
MVQKKNKSRKTLKRKVKRGGFLMSSLQKTSNAAAYATGLGKNRNTYCCDMTRTVNGSIVGAPKCKFSKSDRCNTLSGASGRYRYICIEPIIAKDSDGNPIEKEIEVDVKTEEDVTGQFTTASKKTLTFYLLNRMNADEKKYEEWRNDMTKNYSFVLNDNFKPLCLAPSYTTKDNEKGLKDHYVRKDRIINIKGSDSKYCKYGASTIETLNVFDRNSALGNFYDKTKWFANGAKQMYTSANEYKDTRTRSNQSHIADADAEYSISSAPPIDQKGRGKKRRSRKTYKKKNNRK